MNTDPRIDAYIEKAAPFAKPILEHIRKLVHKACPQVEETMKWSFPHFDYKGMMCSMASFKQHCSFGFWKASLMSDPEGRLAVGESTGMGSFGKIRALEDLPSDKTIINYIKEAVKLNDDEVKLPPATTRKRGVVKEPVTEPAYFTALLKKDKTAKAAWDAFAPSHRKEYLEWITGAKTDATREKRTQKTLEQIVEGKTIHWKYK